MAAKLYFFPDLTFSQPNLSRMVSKDAENLGEQSQAFEGLFGGETCKSGAVISSNAWQPTGF
jgi:hypothetical protein